MSEQVQETTQGGRTVRDLGDGAEALERWIRDPLGSKAKGFDFAVADMRNSAHGFRVQGQKGDYYYVTVEPHKSPSCTCNAGEHGFGSCTKGNDHLSLAHVCKHVRVARVRYTYKAWPAAIFDEEVLLQQMDKIYDTIPVFWQEAEAAVDPATQEPDRPADDDDIPF